MPPSTNVIDVGAGEPLLFVHGFPLDHSMWDAQIEFFASDFRVIAPDLPGFGKSDPLSELVIDENQRSMSAFTMPAFADWLASMLDNLKIDHPVTLVGLSMGGYIGWEFLRRHPTRLSRLVAANTRTGADSEVVSRARKIAANQVMETGTIPVADAMIEKLFAPVSEPPTESETDIRKKAHSVMAKTIPSSIAGGHLGMECREDAANWIGEAAIPMLFMAGELDTITPADEMETDSKLAANSKFAILKDAGHLAPIERPQLFNQRLLQFLKTEPLKT